MNISLTPELEQLVCEKVKSGRYLSVSDVVYEALQLLEERDRQQQMRLETLRQEIAIGIEQTDKGEVFDGEEVIQELLDEIVQARQGNQ
ncbi:type II toxin-antitoxin system ParD family antitoxin [Argonema antarcticum]|uniref:type II toxin-antitoxin system ParD family antitoxin n=1 Tax=Argonema antarcticum TaxID=2942763 RepID=UPI0020126443|nr:type II toxin-antitoxin system ParD family antitoxin [Argonema antarcticum]MCL1469873.1 type II toxin-antitoxin system ParD family antitoxin [Argonema antarcticum A004/B2]